MKSTCSASVGGQTSTCTGAFCSDAGAMSQRQRGAVQLMVQLHSSNGARLRRNNAHQEGLNLRGVQEALHLLQHLAACRLGSLETPRCGARRPVATGAAYTRAWMLRAHALVGFRSVRFHRDQCMEICELTNSWQHVCHEGAHAQPASEHASPGSCAGPMRSSKVMQSAVV